MHVFLGLGEAVHLLQGHFHLLQDLQLPFVPLMESDAIMPYLRLLVLEQFRRLLRHVQLPSEHLLTHIFVEILILYFIPTIS